MRFIFCLIILSGLGLAAPAIACGPEVTIQFSESSPDRIHIKFVRGPKLRLTSLRINLSGSAAGAIFDDHGGLEMQGPQPGPSGVAIRSIKYRTQGQETVTLTFDGFDEQRTFDFLSDLDDSGSTGDRDQNHLVEGELTGAAAHATLLSENGRHIQIEGRFDKLGRARLGERACV